MLLLVGRQHGFIQVGGEQYLIEPVKGHSEDGGHPHLIYRRSAVHQQPQPASGNVSLCGLDDGSENAMPFNNN